MNITLLREIYILTILMFCVCFSCTAQPDRKKLNSNKVNPITKVSTRDSLDIHALLEKGRKEQDAFYTDSALATFYSVLRKSDKLNYAYGKVNALMYIGRTHSFLGDYQNAIASIKKSVSIALEERGICLDLIPFLYNGLALSYVYSGEFEEAMKYLYQSEAWAKQYDKIPFLGLVYSNIATVMSEMFPISEDIQQMAIYYLNRADSISRNSNYHLLRGGVLINKGSYYLRNNQLSNAQLYLDSALKHCFKYNLLEYYAIAHLTLASLSNKRGDYQKALIQCAKAYSLQQHLNPNYILRLKINEGVANFHLKKYEKALHILNDAREYAIFYRLNTHRVEIEDHLCQIFEIKEDDKMALLHFKQYVALKDSITGQQTILNIKRLELKSKVAEKDKILAQKESMISLQKKDIARRDIWIAISALGIFLLACLLFLVYKNTLQKGKLQKTQLINAQKEKDIELLKAISDGEEKERARLGRELHDGIGGMLATIKMNLNGMKNEDSYKLEDEKMQSLFSLVDETANEVRKVAHNLMPDTLVKYTLTEALVYYLDMISGNNLDIHLDFKGSWTQLNKKVELTIYRVVQELVQNIIKHAQAKNAYVQLLKNDKTIIISVEDDGVGFDLAEKNEGYGILNLKYRIQALKGIINISSELARGTIVHIEFSTEQLS